MTQVELAGRATAAEAELLARLRAGDEAAFEALVARHYGTMLAVAQTYVKGRATAEEVVQETWLAVIQGLERFEGRASLKTWILAILVNKAKTRGVREARSVPFTALAGEDEEPAVAPERFRGANDAFPGHWRAYPTDWRSLPAEVLRGEETRRVVEDAIAALPVEQRAAITLRDVLRCPPREACAVLDVPDEELRRRLHGARSRVRAALERHLDD
jgi:RNA polymerase sigma-70 factor (ECF subfamily)